MISSITSKEFYSSKQTQTKVDFKVSIQAFIYDGSKYIYIQREDKIYEVQRTYQNGIWMELYASESSLKKEEMTDVSQASDAKSNLKSEGTEIEEVKKVGGSYGELKKEGWGWNSEPPKEIHHMPSNESSFLETNDGPAIVMDYEDHRKTASCGRSRDAQEYRAKQKELIDQGKFREAMQMDIDDIHEKFGTKYDEGINQMLDYYKELETNKII